MTDVINLTKKAFTWSVVVMTIAWSIGLSALAAPLAANGAECPTLEAGDLFKVKGNSAVYLLNSDMKRLYFPTSEVFHTWFSDFSGVVEIDSTCVSAYPNAVNPSGINYRPGSRLVKVTISPEVYAVGPGNVRHLLGSEDEAKALYGNSWASLVRDVHDFHWPNYTTGAEVNGLHNGMLVKRADSSMIYAVVDGKLTAVDGTLSSFVAGDVHTVASSLVDALELSVTSVTAASLIANPSQGSGSGSGSGTPGTPVDGGDLTVSLAADTPAVTTLSNSTVNNDIMKVTLRAGDKSVEVKGISVRKTGLLANARVNGVSVWVDGYRKGDVMSSFNSDNKVTLGFGGSSIVIPANSSKTLTISFNFDSNAIGGTVGAQLAASTDIDTTAKVTGSFPLSSGTFGLTDGSSSLASVSVEGQSVGGQSTEPVTADSGQIEIGETKEVAKFKFTEAGTNDGRVERLIFYVEGSVQDSDLKNFELYAPDNTLLGSAVSMDDRYVTIMISGGYEIPKGSNRTLTLKANVLDGAGRWFRIQLQNDYDLSVKDGDTQYYILPTDSNGEAWSAVTPTTGYFKLKAGTATVSKKTDSASGQLSPGATDVSLAKFEVRAVGEAIEVRKLGLKIATSTVTTRLTGNVKVVVDGTTVLTTSAASNNLYSSASTQYTLSSYVTIPSGETKIFEVVGSVDTNAVATSEYQAKVGNMYLKRLSTKDYQDNKPSSSLTTANNLTMSANTFTISEDTSVGDSNLSTGSVNLLGQWTLKAPAAQGADVTAASFSFASNGLTVATDLQNLTLWANGVQLGSTISTAASSSNSFTFNNLSLNKSGTVKLMLKGNVLSTATAEKTLTATLSSLTWIGKSTQSSTDNTTGYGAQTNTVRTSSVTVTGFTDASTISKILTPSGESQEQLGKWEVSTLYEDATFNKMRFYLNTTGTQALAFDTASTNFGDLYLYDSANMTTPLATGSYISSGAYVEFSGMNWTAPADSTKYLVLKGKVNASGTMTSQDVSAWSLGATSTTDLEVYTSGGSNITTSGVTFSTPTSTYYLFHDTKPVITNYSVGTSLELSSQAKVFAFTVANPGTVPLVFSSTTLDVTVTGLTSATSNTGTISDFQLWEANSSGDLGTLLAQNASQCLSGAAGVTGCSVSNTTSTIFNSSNDVNSLMANGITIPAGGSRTFILTANTTDVLDGKSQGTVSVSAKIDGSTGKSFTAADAAYEVDWSGGNFMYYYKQSGQSSNSGPFNASDSYDVIGSALSRAS